MRTPIIYLSIFLLCCFNMFGQNCPNMNFEQGNTSNWVIDNKSFIGNTTFQQQWSTYLTGSWNTGGGDFAKMYGPGPLSKDPRTCNVVSPIAPNGKYSYMLGDSNNIHPYDALPAIQDTCSVTRARYTITVDQKNAIIVFQYAAVLSIAELNLHPDLNTRPFFSLNVIRQKDGKIINPTCGSFKAIADKNMAGFTTCAPYKDPRYTKDDSIAYKNWTAVGIDLTAEMGNVVTLEFMASTCTGSGNHWSYAYIDAQCYPVIDTVTVCAGTPVTLTAPNGFTSYTWDDNATGTTKTINNPTTGERYVTLGTTATCTVKRRFYIKVETAPPTNAGTNATFCSGGSAPLGSTPVAGNTYSWKPATGLSNSSIANPNVTHTNTTATPAIYNYTLTLTTTAGCTSTSTVKVTVNPYPTLSASNTTICKGATTALTASGATTYSWSPATGLSQTTGASVNVTLTTPQTYVISGTKNGCTSSTQINVSIDNCLFVFAHDTTICEGRCAILLAEAGSGTPNYIYTWSNGASHLSTVCPTVTTNYTVSVTDSKGNTASDILTVTVEPVPTVNANSPSICNGQSTTLTATGAVNYTWTPGTGLNVTTGATVTAKPPTTTSYTVTGSTSAGCTNTVTISVTVFAVPTISVVPLSICPGTSGMLSASGANSYSWTPNTNITPNPGNPVTVNPMTTTTYTVIGANNDGCKDTTTVKVSVTPTLLLNANSPTVCIGKSATITVNGATNYTWTPASSLNTSTGNTVISTVSSKTTYTVNGRDNAGCTGSTVATVYIDPLPILRVNDEAICLGSSKTLTVSGATNYTWTPAASLNPSTGSGVIANPTTTTQYSISATSAAGCTASATMLLTVNPLPTITAKGDTICERDPGYITAKGGVTYVWKPGNLNGDSVKVSPPSTTIYTVTGTDAKGCSGTATAELYVKLYPFVDFVPDPPITDVYNKYIYFYNLSTPNLNYSWTFGDDSTSTQYSTGHTYKDTGHYEVCLFINRDGCIGKTCKPVVVLPDWTFYVPDAFSPNGDGKNDLFIGLGTNIKEYEMWIFDRWGNMIYHCKDMTQPWNGRVDNDLDAPLAQEDVYVWKIKIKDIFDKKHQFIGHVTIVK
jgi:gliding motility-associated-like protein